ncbi:hypothetical protein B5M47_02115 [candidate division CPR3 bacterium 4484_211]|uniref:Uncharacterized protein n=1 Tax=candidate division CPR3 bacterium 4484_211 TaxID=1968527 RepID=A0A1W9NY82_UNCC3|nr:MAG: hypothetical protein B5M47_02115 [candidate division CPR3 bacterium 4484_211]
MLKQLKALKDLAKSPGMVKDALDMQRKLTAEEVTVDHGDIEITMRGDFYVKQVKISGEIRNDLKDAFNYALKQVQQSVAKKMMGI